jgi:hypothetical protein
MSESAARLVRVVVKCARIANGSIQCELDANAVLDELRLALRRALSLQVDGASTIRIVFRV